MRFTMKGNKTLAIFIALALTITVVPVFAQNQSQGQNQGQAPQTLPQQQTNIEVDKAEMKKFAKAYKAIRQIQQDSNTKVEQAFSNSDIDRKRFNELYKARQQQGQNKAQDESSEETKQYQKVMKQIRSIQKANQQKMVSKIEQYDISVQRFNKLLKAIRTDKELAQRLQQYL